MTKRTLVRLQRSGMASFWGVITLQLFDLITISMSLTVLKRGANSFSLGSSRSWGAVHVQHYSGQFQSQSYVLHSVCGDLWAAAAQRQSHVTRHCYYYSNTSTLRRPATTTASLCHFHRLDLLQDHGTTIFSRCTAVYSTTTTWDTRWHTTVHHHHSSLL